VLAWRQGLGARWQRSKRERETGQSSGLSCSTRSRLVGVARRLRPLHKPCTNRWGNSEPEDFTAPACSGSIAPSARLPAGSRATGCLLQPLAPARAFRKGLCPPPHRVVRWAGPPIQHISWVEGCHRLCKTALQFSPLLGESGARSLHHSDVPALHHHPVPH
jgi:hypothetical protein